MRHKSARSFALGSPDQRRFESGAWRVSGASALPRKFSGLTIPNGGQHVVLEDSPGLETERGILVKTLNHGFVARAGVAVVALTGVAVVVPGIQAAQAAGGGMKATVVEGVSRSPVGKMLATTSGASLYTLSTGSCTGSCLTVWPPLLMPAGKTKPRGAECLSTVSMAGGLQVTYDNKPLYTFEDDSGTSLNGNHVAGFVAAKIKKACPAS
jgi:predicted lipoprotein with Yx(FWY)xxD motif